MKILLPNIKQNDIIFELQNIGARKIYTIVFNIEFFDFASHNPKFYTRPLRSPKGFSRLFDKLNAISKSNRTLEQSLISLSIFEDENLGQVLMKKLASQVSNDLILFEFEFKIARRAQLEEILLTSGLQVVKSVDIEKTIFMYSSLVAKYSLIVENQNIKLLVEAPDQDRIIKALNLIGHTIDEGKMQ